MTNIFPLPKILAVSWWAYARDSAPHVLPLSCIPSVLPFHETLVQETSLSFHTVPSSGISVRTPHDTCNPISNDLYFRMTFCYLLWVIPPSFPLYSKEDFFTTESKCQTLKVSLVKLVAYLSFSKICTPTSVTHHKFEVVIFWVCIWLMVFSEA